MKRGFDERQQQQAAKIGSVSFLVMFLLCPVVILVQMLFLESTLTGVAGETLIMLAGGATYLISSSRNGVFAGSRENPMRKNLIISLVCSGIFSLLYGYLISRKVSSPVNISRYAAFFFIGVSILCFAVLTGLDWLSKRVEKKQEEKYSDS